MIKMVALFFNSVFSSYDANINDDENPVFQIEDKSEPYNIALMNAVFNRINAMNIYLETHYDVLRLSYGLDSEKLSANESSKIYRAKRSYSKCKSFTNKKRKQLIC